MNMYFDLKKDKVNKSDIHVIVTPFDGNEMYQGIRVIRFTINEISM